MVNHTISVGTLFLKEIYTNSGNNNRKKIHHAVNDAQKIYFRGHTKIQEIKDSLNSGFVRLDLRESIRSSKCR